MQVLISDLYPNKRKLLCDIVQADVHLSDEQKENFCNKMKEKGLHNDFDQEDFDAFDKLI